ncbi:MAG TPA: hypothetical protein VK679_12585 [Gemmatimonadaceae bacterium]|jgi:hypothetical protein|nr:hypothetical protein [Gemmatimonadaceae bacterium]
MLQALGVRLVSVVVLSAAGSHAIRPAAATGPCRDVTSRSGTFHLSRSTPTLCLTHDGMAGILKVHNTGPANLVVRNTRNNMSLAPNSEIQIAFDGETLLSISPQRADTLTDGTYEVSDEAK